ncbi:PH domain-containing protein [Salinisphaera sp.]|uniref:PH domain-containing protein n=1 Tax=Salinisphaera sp. TaxID=1914330 RepID=UPI002D774700|nr:PH domain-containing protein [Salinisphaera sp.]HET7315302.1 PH domain-containing protein [Salinisphaera sp.]
MGFDFKNADKAALLLEAKRMAKEIGDDQFFTKKELKYLPEVLFDGEEVVAFASGMLDSNTWLLVLTDRRVVFLDKGMFYGLKQTEIALDKIDSVSSHSGMLLAKIKLQVSSKEWKIDQVQKKAAAHFAKKIRDLIDQRSSVSGTVRQDVSAGQDDSNDVISRLERLSGLKEKGVLTDAEFQSEKAKLLS